MPDKIPCTQIESYPSACPNLLHVQAATKEGYIIVGEFKEEEAQRFILMKKPFFKNWREMRNYWADCYDSNIEALSHGEQVIIEALQTLSDNYAWDIYMAIHRFIDPRLKHLTHKPE